MPREDIIVDEDPVERMQAIERRLDATERNQSDHARSLTEIVKHVSGVETRVVKLEAAYQEDRVERAARIEREKSLLERITRIDEAVEKLQNLKLEGTVSDVTSIKDGFNKMFWLLGGTIITGFGALLFIVFRQGLGI